MHFPTASLTLLAASAHAVNIISSNDDGWAEINIRELYKSLSSGGHDVLVSSPAENQSGAGTKTKHSCIPNMKTNSQREKVLELLLRPLLLKLVNSILAQVVVRQ